MRICLSQLVKWPMPALAISPHKSSTPGTTQILWLFLFHVVSSNSKHYKIVFIRQPAHAAVLLYEHKYNYQYWIARCEGRIQLLHLMQVVFTVSKWCH